LLVFGWCIFAIGKNGGVLALLTAYGGELAWQAVVVNLKKGLEFLSKF
jgi:hypothetical protein